MLSIQHLSFPEYDSISLKVEAAEGASISGPSGCGKTCLLRSIADLDPHQGDIQLFDVKQTDVSGPVWRQQTGFLSDSSGFWDETVGQHFQSASKEQLHQYLQQLNLDSDLLDQTTMKLSSGEKQRLALIRLLLGKPRALLLDEPTSHLDPDSVTATETLILDYQQTHRCPVLWVSHSQAQRNRVASKHFIMKDKQLIEAPA